ncbi:unnamed protein product [Nesidiocoris tenuis]|uniref:Uncharacterized protein n=1 Tax=Nesidiocoris tenuis TaxID=355587 RepID=A0A6H5GMZ0_9HEMI|nr:unnamed protein product [Nesidiocoris tenuis]
MTRQNWNPRVHNERMLSLEKLLDSSVSCDAFPASTDSTLMAVLKSAFTAIALLKDADKRITKRRRVFRLSCTVTDGFLAERRDGTNESDEPKATTGKTRVESMRRFNPCDPASVRPRGRRIHHGQQSGRHSEEATAEDERGLADTRRQHVRHDRQARSSGHPKRAAEVSEHARRRYADVPLPDERLQERQTANAIRRSEGTLFLEIMWAFPTRHQLLDADTRKKPILTSTGHSKGAGVTPRIKSTTPYPIASGRGKQMHCCDWSRCHRRITQLISLTFLGQFPLFIPSSANGTWAFLDRNSKEHRGTNFCTGTRCEKPKASIG